MTGLLVMSCIGGPASAQSVSEDSAKAAFVYRFTDYVEWPATALQRAEFLIASSIRTPTMPPSIVRCAVSSRSLQIR